MCVDCLNKNKVEIYPTMLLLVKKVRNNWWCICHFCECQRYFYSGNNYNGTGHMIHTRIGSK